jgi:hypothetical protein
MKSNILTFVALISLVGCAMKTKILDTAAISMTKAHLNEGEKLSETGPVTGQFCADTWNDKGSFGLIDECVKNAQQQSGVDFILNASVYRSGNCVSVEGTGAKLASTGTATPPSAAPAPAAHGKKTKK